MHLKWILETTFTNNIFIKWAKEEVTVSQECQTNKIKIVWVSNSLKLHSLLVLLLKLSQVNPTISGPTNLAKLHRLHLIWSQGRLLLRETQCHQETLKALQINLLSKMPSWKRLRLMKAVGVEPWSQDWIPTFLLKIKNLPKNSYVFCPFISKWCISASVWRTTVKTLIKKFLTKWPLKKMMTQTPRMLSLKTLSLNSQRKKKRNLTSRNK